VIGYTIEPLHPAAPRAAMLDGEFYIDVIVEKATYSKYNKLLEELRAATASKHTHLA
jgi:hypothetical protein